MVVIQVIMSKGSNMEEENLSILILEDMKGCGEMGNRVGMENCLRINN